MFLYKKQPDTYGVLQDLKVLQLFTVIILFWSWSRYRPRHRL